MSFFAKTEVMLVCDRCGVGRKFETDNTEKIEEVAEKQLGWFRKEDETDRQVKHYCPNCAKVVKGNKDEVENVQEMTPDMEVEVDEE